MILYNYVPFQIGTSLKEKFPLRAVPCGMGNHFYHIRWAPLSVTIITHMRILRNGSYANEASSYKRLALTLTELAYLATSVTL